MPELPEVETIVRELAPRITGRRILSVEVLHRRITRHSTEDIARVLQRGVRGDERVQGHGIGLAIVQDIVHGYRGELHVGASEELGGARFEVVLPPGL